MGWAVNNIMIRGGLESILKGISNVQNTDDAVVSSRDGDNQKNFR